MQLKRSLAAREKFFLKKDMMMKDGTGYNVHQPIDPNTTTTDSQQRLSLFSTLENVVVVILPPL
jgi:hypothetical protein